MYNLMIQMSPLEVNHLFAVTKNNNKLQIEVSPLYQVLNLYISITPITISSSKISEKRFKIKQIVRNNKSKKYGANYSSSVNNYQSAMINLANGIKKNIPLKDKFSSTNQIFVLSKKNYNNQRQFNSHNRLNKKRLNSIIRLFDYNQKFSSTKSNINNFLKK